MHSQQQRSSVVVVANIPVCADAPATCKTFFEDTSPWCLPVTGTWTSVEQFVADLEYSTDECQAEVSATCQASIESFFINLGCPECSDEGRAVYNANVACRSATVEAECTEGLATGASTPAPTSAPTVTAATPSSFSTPSAPAPCASPTLVRCCVLSLRWVC